MKSKWMGVSMSAIAYQCISGDSHLEVDAKRWRYRVPEDETYRMVAGNVVAFCHLNGR